MHAHTPKRSKRVVKLCAHVVEFDFKTNCDRMTRSLNKHRAANPNHATRLRQQVYLLVFLEQTGIFASTVVAMVYTSQARRVPGG